MLAGLLHTLGRWRAPAPRTQVLAATHSPLGAASEETGLDRTLKANTAKKRTLSLFHQGLYWYQATPTMRDDWLEKLMLAFERIIADHRVFREVFAVI